MYDLRLTNGDITVTASGDLELATTKKDLARQYVKVRLSTILTEWFLDTTQGINWLDLLSSRSNKDAVDLKIITTITSTQYITRLRTYSSTYNPKTYKYVVVFTADVEDGSVIEVEQPIN